MKSLSPSQPHAIIMVGIPGSGKSFFAEKFADTFHAPRISQDTIARLGSLDGAASQQIAAYQLQELLKTKQSILFDGSSDTLAERAALAKIVRAAGYATLFVWVQTDPATARLRLIKESKDNPSPLSADAFDKRLKRFNPPSPIEKPVVISGKHTYATQAKVILKRLSAPREQSLSTADITPARTTSSQGRHTIMVR